MLPIKGRLNNDKASGKGKVRLECAAAVQFMRTQRWEALITIYLQEGEQMTSRCEVDYGVMFVGSGGAILPRCACIHLGLFCQDVRVCMANWMAVRVPRKKATRM